MDTPEFTPAPDYAKRMADTLALIAVHEWSALGGHYAELRERVAVARRARGVGELLRDQVDLLPETRARLSQDQLVRRVLLRRWARSL